MKHVVLGHGSSERDNVDHMPKRKTLRLQGPGNAAPLPR